MITDTNVRRGAGRGAVGPASETHGTPDAAAAWLDARARAWSLIVLSGALFLLLAQAFIPIEEFIHRGDDAYYYFKVAANYPRLGFWSFDGVHPTNGVQPLWAILLTGVAQALYWVGITNVHLLARIFVGLAALLHFASSLLLFNLLARTVSTGTGIAVAGAFLFSPGIVWARVWGMENSLYALTLVATVSYFHLTFLRRPAIRPAIILGLLLGLTALSRLNAGIFVACLLGYYLFCGADGRFLPRLRLATIAGGMAAVLILPYFAANYATTGHLLPISGAVKEIGAAQFLRAHGIDSPFSGAFVAFLADTMRYPIRWFVTSRAVDGLWVVGGRLAFDGAIRLRELIAILAALVALPLLLGPRDWLALLRERYTALAAFAYVAVFAVLNATVSVLMHPNQLKYAMIRWWLVESEIIIVVVVATLAVAALGYAAARVLAPRARAYLIPSFLAVLLIFHTREVARYYWDGTYDSHDWNRSWNDESYLAAQWLARELPTDAKIGSWNAGVLGYYAPQSVVNLDGLINNFDLLPYLERHAIGDYIEREGLTHLSDMDSIFATHQLREKLTLTEVYSHYSPGMNQYYRIYRVDK